MKKKFEYMCKHCWHSWRTFYNYECCPKCKSKNIDKQSDRYIECHNLIRQVIEDNVGTIDKNIIDGIIFLVLKSYEMIKEEKINIKNTPLNPILLKLNRGNRMNCPKCKSKNIDKQEELSFEGL